jgi:hypothetical protein
MTATDTTSSAPTAGRLGYALAIAINAALLFAMNVWPGWGILPFLTEDFVQVLGLVDLGFTVAVAANAVYLLADQPVVRATGDLVTTAIGLAATVRLLQVFPFAFPRPGFDWALLVRVLLVLGIVGTSIALLVTVVPVIRLAAGWLAGPRVR